MGRPADDLSSDPLLHTAPLLEGFKVLDPAVLYAKVGAGGMGAVYRGRHFSLECDVAVKVLKPDLAEDEQFVLRFEREARLAARIKNDNVVQVLDVRQKNGIHYLVMEFVRGETARERVQRKGRLAEAEALAIVAGAARGLRAAHQDGIVHRDIKPENILVAADGAVKLADLGLAKQRRRTGEEQSLAMLSTGVMGTPQYMPPEQWRSADVTPAADVWALGATLWFLLAGRSAIRGGELLEVAERIRDLDFPAIALERPDVRPEVAALIEHCTRRDPAERFSDARELLRALQPLVAGDDDELLVDAASGSSPSRLAVVTPPPRSTLAKIKLQLAGEPDATQPRPASDPHSEQPTVPRAGDTVREGGPTGDSLAMRMGLARRARRRRAAAIATAVLLVGAIGGAGYAAGWFDGPRPGPAGSQPPEASDPARDGRPLVGVDAAQNARRAMATGVMELPKPGRLDAAIAAFDEALRLDAGLDEARQKLVLALGSKAKGLEATDPDAAYVTARRAHELLPTDARANGILDGIVAVLRQRLAASVSLTEPGEAALLAEREVHLRGRATAPGLRRLRAVLVPAMGAADAPFPAAYASDVPVVAGEFEARLTAAADGSWALRLEVEDERGMVAEAPRREFVVDGGAPVLSMVSPEELQLVGADVEVSGRVASASEVSVRVNDEPATVDPDGYWHAHLHLPDQVQKVVIVARNASGREASRTLTLRVDAAAPVLTASLPEWTNRADLAIEGRVEDDSAVMLTLNGSQVQVAAGGSFAGTAHFPEERVYEFTFVATDAFGNVTRKVLPVRYDRTAPQLAWTTPERDGVAPGDVIVAGTVTDASPCEVWVNGAPAKVEQGRWSAPVHVQPDRTVEVHVNVRDAAGNLGWGVTKTLRGERP